MTNTKRFAIVLGLAVALDACGVHQTTPPPLTGPSDISTTFTITTQQVVVGVPIAFDGSASTPGQGATQITSYQWNFGDGSTGSGRTTTHTFTQSGSFTVVLTTVNDRGATSSFGRSVSVTLSTAPTGDFFVSPTQPNVGDTVTLTANVTPGPGRTIKSYAWDFGDGTSTGPSTSQQTTHSYHAAATYVIVLTAVDDAGQQAVLSKNVTVATGNPTAIFTFSPASPNPGNTVTFDATASTAVGNATITSYTWSIGGVQASGAIVTHVFPNVGTFPVTLTVMDDQGRKAVAFQNVVVVTPTP
jgi:PKD repeat protein